MTDTWKEISNADGTSYLHKSFKFENFIDAFSFMTSVALLAEKANHHPDWRNVYNSVDIKLSTHDAGDIISDKDRKLAEKIDITFKI